MDVTWSVTAGVLVIAIIGEVDMATAPALAAACAQVAGIPLKLDMLACTFLDSSGAKVIIDEARTRQVRIDGSPEVVRTLTLLGLTGLLT